MLSVFEYEKRLDDNFFVIKFQELEPYFLIKLLPFRVWVLEDYVPGESRIDTTALGDDSADDMGNVTPLFILTNHCNLACSYCYADEGSYGCDGAFMPPQVIEQTFDGLLEVYTRHIEKNQPKVFQVNAVCFGGEPLLHVPGLETVLREQQRVAEALRQRFPDLQVGVKQHINSNGYCISQQAGDYLRNNRQWLEMVFSFDGLNHDKHRLSKDGLPSSKDALDSIRLYAGMGIDVSVTCCLQPDELADFRRNIEYIFSVMPENVSVNFSFLRGSLHFRDAGRENKEYLYDPQQVMDVARVIAEYIQSGHNIYNRKFDQLQQRAFLYRCPAIGKKEMCIMPDGGIYPCHNFVDGKYTYGKAGDPDTFRMENKLFDSYLEQRRIYDTPGCADCCMKSICLSSFDCPSHSLFDLGDIHKNDEVVCNFGRIVQRELLLNGIKALLGEE